MWDRYGAQSGKVSVSLRKIRGFQGPGDRPGPPGRGAETLREQLWATKRTLEMRGRRFRALRRRFRATLDAKIWSEGRFPITFGNGRAIREVAFDTKVMISCFKSKCVSKNVLMSETIRASRLFFGVGGSGRRPVSPPTPEGSGVWGTKWAALQGHRPLSEAGFSG